MSKKKVVALIKIGKRKFMEDLYHKGIVYMNPIEYFRIVEGSKARQDKAENASLITHPDRVLLKEPSKGSLLNIQKTPSPRSHRMTYSELYMNEGRPANLFCMYGVSNEWDNSKGFVDQRVLEFGDGDPYMVVITNATEFLSRIKNKLRWMGLFCDHGGVIYYDRRSYTGALTGFHKPKEYAYQNEFRIKVDTNVVSPLVFSIGPLQDTAKLVKVREFIKIEVGNPT